MISARALARPSIEVRPYRLRLKTPLRTAHGELAFREGFLVLAHDGSRTGRGEAAPLPGFGTETLAQCAEELRREDPRTPAARHGVELALLDLRAQCEGVPLAKLLDPAAAASVEVSALLAAKTMPELAREAQRAVAEGFRTVKLKAGFDDDFARAAVVRDAVGGAVRIRVDANAAWDRAQALRKLHELAPLGIEFCEQPTGDLLGLEESPVPIAADELVATDRDAALQRAQVVILKPMALGGVVAALQLGREAMKRGRTVVVTSSLDGAIGRAGAAHLAAALRAVPAAGLATGRLLVDDHCDDTLAPHDGAIAIRGPGLGL